MGLLAIEEDFVLGCICWTSERGTSLTLILADCADEL